MMEDNNALEIEKKTEQKEASKIDFALIYRILVLNWKWFVLSLIIALGLAAIYLRYTPRVYQSSAKLLIKDNTSNGSGRRNSNINVLSMGEITSTQGIDNEMEILQSREIAAEAIRDLKLYVNYTTKGRVLEVPRYKDNPLTVDIDATHLEKLNCPIRLTITRSKGSYQVTGSYAVPVTEESYEGPFTLNKTFTSLPYTIPTRAGNITISEAEHASLANGQSVNVTIQSPRDVANRYVGALKVAQLNKQTSIINISFTDVVPERATDYIKQLAVVYNRQANEDKNAVAIKTEKFINSRLEKINSELGETEGQLQSYKQKNGMVELKMNAGNSVANQNSSEQKLADIDTQIELLSSITSFMNESSRNYQVLPSNVGLDDASCTSLIAKYNELVLERNRLLRTASESSPVVEPLTEQIHELNINIKSALGQARRSLEIQKSAIETQYAKYNEEIAETPQQERMLTQIGRQQEVKSGLYLTLLQKREENSISLAATADKGKLLDEPQSAGIISPNRQLVFGIALLIGLALPALILFIVQFFRYKIEGHDDVAKLTKLPIIADVAVASNQAKGVADIVVHENQNNMMEEIFRSLRTNILFMLKPEDKVILFTSTTSGEGKTFNCSNVAVSFALLGKKVIIVGLDIRKPRLAELFCINDHRHGITNLLVKNKPTAEEVNEQILPSGINDNLDLLMAGPIPPNPGELISRQSLNDIFDILKEKYDYILIDTAPVGLVTDTLQIARIADASVYMCRADYTAKASFNLINELANDKKLPNMAIVINGIDMSKKKYGYYYGYGRYGKYGRYGSYGKYGSYGSYGSYGNYQKSHYGNPKDNSIKTRSFKLW